MNKIDQEYYIKLIDLVINSTESKISKKDIEFLVIIREGMKEPLTKEGVLRLLEILWKLFK